MADATDDELEELRKERRQEIAEKLEDGGSASPGEPVHVDGQAELDEVVADHDVVLVDFYADWCGPCQMLEPIVEDVAAETEATVAKVDVDQNQALSRQYGVQGVPTMLLFANGEQVEQIVGVRDKSTLVQLVEQAAS